jgi:hypothetical protein
VLGGRAEDERITLSFLIRRVSVVIGSLPGAFWASRPWKALVRSLVRSLVSSGRYPHEA